MHPGGDYYLLPSSSITLSLGVFAMSILIAIVFGGCVGYIIGSRHNIRDDGAPRIKIHSQSRSIQLDDDTDDDHPKTSTTNNTASENNNIIEDGPTLVLRGSLDLMSSKWGGGGKQLQNSSSSSVVEYLSPEQMTKLLFTKVDRDGTNISKTLCLDEYHHHSLGEKKVCVENNKVPSPKSSATDIVNLLSSTSQTTKTTFQEGEDDNTSSSSSTIITTTTTTSSNNIITPTQFLKLLSSIQKYSVNTSHPYFFNQLFGALDPIALAAEIVALSVNTSVYTYETAPVFTLMEREVMGQIGKLVFEHDNDTNQSDEEKEGVGEDEGGVVEEKFEGEGLMIPGGSLANLTAMHAARHRWKVMNGYTRQQTQNDDDVMMMMEDEYWYANDDEEEEKKLEDISQHGGVTNMSTHRSQQQQQQRGMDESHLVYDYNKTTPDLVAFVSSEAHYSFSKSARVLGLREDDLIVIPTHSDGRMNVRMLAKKIEELELLDNNLLHVSSVNQDIGDGGVGSRVVPLRKRVPFFVACTAGSTVRGSFDEVAEIVKVCRDYESRGSSSSSASYNNYSTYERSIWVHVDGAWGGSAIFSSRPSLRSTTHMDEIRLADSFTFNPHKMLGAPQQTTAFIVRHRNALRNASAVGAKYLFDPRKNGAEYDLGDLSYTCGRRTDAVKLWALWKYYGKSGLGQRVDQKVDELELFVDEIKRRESFALACKPWPFNVNFFYFPPRIRQVLKERGVGSDLGRDGISWTNNNGCDRDDAYIEIPDDIAEDLANISVMLKLRLHEAGEVIIPYQVREILGV